jgi:tetratricopeptide (TPR) repeat protein
MSAMTSKPVLPPELLAVNRNPWDSAIEGFLAVLLAFMPFAFGAVNAWSELIVFGLAAVLSAGVLIRAAVDRDFQLPWTWTYAPLIAFLLLICLQSIPLPRSLTSFLSPGSAQIRAELLGEGDSAARSTVSLYPLATTHGIRLVLAGCAVYFVVVSVFRTKAQIKRLLLIVFVIGCAEAALALLQILTGADRLYWSIDPGAGRVSSGSFVNYSNFSQFMNLSIGAGLALLLVRLESSDFAGRRRIHASRPMDGVRVSEHGGILLGLIFCAVSIFTSLSRNGAISLAVAGGIVGIGLYVRGTLSRGGWILAMLPLGGLAVLLVGGFDRLYGRLATLQDADLIAGRWELTQGTLRAWRTFPVFGAGLGTHELVFPMFGSGVSAFLAQHADNDYAELLEETGLIGAACVVAFLAMITAKLVRLCRRGRSPLSAAAFGLAFGLIAVAIHSATDFGQHVPAVFCLSAVVCGLTVQLVRHEWPPSEPLLRREVPRMRRWGAGFAAAATALVWAWVLRGAYAEHIAEQWWYAAELVDDGIQAAGLEASDDEYADLLAAAEQAVAHQPGNVEYGYWLNLHRWRALARNVDSTGGVPRLNAAARPLVARIADELSDVRQKCPTYGPPYALEGQLRLIVLDEAKGGELIRKGVQLAPYDAPTCLIAGELAAREGRVDEAVQYLRRAAALAPLLYADVVSVVLFGLRQPDLARELAGQDFARLQQLADIAASREDYRQFADELRREADAILRRRARDNVATPNELAMLAHIEAGREQYEAAAEYYRRALTLEYSQVAWRLARIRALMAIGKDKEALREANICRRIAPSSTVQQLIDELTVRVESSSRGSSEEG